MLTRGHTDSASFLLPCPHPESDLQIIAALPPNTGLTGVVPICYPLESMQKPGTCVPSPFSRVRLFAIIWTVVRQVRLSLGFSRLDYGNGLPFRSAGNVPSPGIEPVSPVLQADSLRLSHRKPKYMGTTSFFSSKKQTPSFFFFLPLLAKKREGQPHYDHNEESPSVLSGAKCEKESVKPHCNSFSDALFPLWENDVVQLPLPPISAQRATFLFLAQLLL